MADMTQPPSKTPRTPKSAKAKAAAARGDKDTKRTLTPEDMVAAARLKEIWESIPKAERPTQEELAGRFQSKAPNQSLISQYLNGKIALNYYALLFFAKELRFRPEDVRSDLIEQQLANEIAISQLGRLAVNRVASAARVVTKFLNRRDAKLDLTREDEAGLFLDAVAEISTVEGSPAEAEEHLGRKIADIAKKREVRNVDRDRTEGAGSTGSKTRQKVAS